MQAKSVFRLSIVAVAFAATAAVAQDQAPTRADMEQNRRPAVPIPCEPKQTLRTAQTTSR